MTALGITLTYLAVGLTWIAFSDQALLALVDDLELLSRLQTWKGWAYVLVTAGLLFLLIHPSLAARDRQAREARRVERILEHSPVLAIEWQASPGWPVTYVSSNAERWGLEREALLAGTSDYASLIHHEDLPVIVEDVQHHIEQGPDEYTQIYRLVLPRRGVVWVEDRTWLSRDVHGQVTRIHGVLLDITERRHLEEERERQMERLERAERDAGLGIWEYDPDNGFWWSEQLFRLLGHAPDSPEPDVPTLLQRDLDTATADGPRLATALRDMAAGTPPERQCLQVRRHPSRGPETWLRFSIQRPLRGGADGWSVRGTALDVTELRQAELELRALNADLERRVQQRTAELQAANQELESFSYAVSHDLKAPLRGIEGYSRLLEADHGERLNDEGREFLTRIREGVTQMNELIGDLLAYSHMERRPLEQRRIRVRELVEEILRNLETEYPAAATATIDVPEELEIETDPDGLGLILRNLLENAFKFSAGRERPQVRIRGQRRTGNVRLEVEDNGIGFSEAFQERIFEIFQRLNRAEDYGGTGVGLALVRRAARRLDARIETQSRPDEGATFRVELPQ
ncbi:ATP-binding protein [Thioalkalivibrio sp. ALJ24]|uniref:sensor histidine kinase n=1 Tax=Thioalkalivibrio sp. ALJ24 TaxID=545276 RepID=UPI00035C0C51